MWPEHANIWFKLHIPVTGRTGSVTMNRFCEHESVANNGSYMYCVDSCMLDQVKGMHPAPSNNSSILQLLNVRHTLVCKA